MFRAGRRLAELREGTMTFRELFNFIRHPLRDSSYGRELLGESADWSTVVHLLAAIHDRLADANWQRSGGKGQRPKRLPRPGGSGQHERHYGNTAGRSQRDVKALLARAAGRPAPA